MSHVPPDSTSGAEPGGPTGAPNDPLRSILQLLRPPGWVIDELQNRLVLFLNHVLQQESAATERLRRQAGKPLRVQWGDFHFCVAPTRAGLLERVDPVQYPPELTVSLTQASPAELARRVLSGEKPAVDIQGDVQFAAEVAWLVDNVRWDLEEDLSRLIGDAAAHTLVGFARQAAQAIKGFAARMPRPPGTGGGAGQ